MNIPFTNKRMRRVTAIVAIACIIFAGAGCAQIENNNTPTDEDHSPPLTEIEKMYNATIDGYLNDIPAEQPGAAASSEEQVALVNKMAQLYEQKASSFDLHSLYIQGITKLSPAQADEFTAYAIAGMNRNSFSDYTAVENYASDSEFFERFLNEGKSIGYKYVYFNLETENIKDPEIKELVDNAKKQGYYLDSSEGMLYYSVDFTVFAKYRLYNTQPMASIIETLAIDSLDPMTRDAAFVVSGENLAARTYRIEKLIADYKGTKYEQYLAVRFRDNMGMLFFGVNNTPAFSYETGVINDETLALFKDVQTLDSTLMGKSVKEFMIILDANGYMLDEVTRAKANDILAAIDVKYGLTDQVVSDYRQWMMGE